MPTTGRKPIVIIAPGSGLGHLVRASAISVFLRMKNMPVVIVTNSFWSQALNRITGLETLHIPTAKWAEALVPCLKKLGPGLIVQDTFPFGFRKEYVPSIFPEIPQVYLARILKIENYLDTDERLQEFSFSRNTTIIKTEPLTDIHSRWIANSGCSVVSLPHRICFPFHAYAQKVPKPLQQTLDSASVHLVVHSGPVHETEQLIFCAEKRMKKEGGGSLAIINPFFCEQGRKDAWDYFPAAVLYRKASHIYSGGGYNAVSEQVAFRAKVTRIPFARTYDDQAFRINQTDLAFSGGNGAKVAASIIEDMYH